MTAATELLPATTTMGAVHVTVADLERALDYYRETVGLAVLEEGPGKASLGAGGVELLGLVEEPGARPASRHTGLYHFALRVPERVDLARWLAHAAREHVALLGMSDHFVSEAIYLTDPDGHGIEIYHDRPRVVWEGLVGARMTTDPLDVADLMGELDDPATEPFDGLPAGTDMGHVHLQVADVGATIDFYRDVLGLRRHGRAVRVRCLPGGRRLPPSRGREHLAQPRGASASSGHRRASIRDHRSSR